MRFEEVLHDVFMDYDRGLIEPTRQYEFGTQPFKINIHDEKIEISGVEVTEYLPADYSVEYLLSISRVIIDFNSIWNSILTGLKNSLFP
mgnify:CR=1 FL=1